MSSKKKLPVPSWSQTQETLQRGVPVRNIEAERSVIGAMLINSSAIDACVSVIAPEDFYTPAHQEICRTCFELWRVNQPVDILTVQDALDSQGIDAGGQKYLADIVESVWNASNAAYYAKIVRDCARRRALSEIGQHMISAAYEAGSDPDDFAALAQSYADHIREGKGQAHAVTPPDYLDGYLSNLKALQDNGGVAGIPTPYPELNRYIAGLVPGEVIVLAGTPGTGKTALALNIMTNAAKCGHPVAIVSMEMVKAGLTNRIFSACANVDAQNFRTGRFTSDDWRRIGEFSETMRSWPLMICDKPNVKPSELRQLCRNWKRDRGLKLLVIDYLQLMRPETKGDSQSREREVAEISRNIKMLAIELEIPVLVLAQLNRESVKSKEPEMHHLRESGAIEQDADIILFICPWKVDDARMNCVTVDIKVGKGRSNATGKCQLVYHRRFTKFGNLAKE